MSKSSRPQHDPAELAAAAEALQAAAARLLAAGVPLKDVTALATSATAYAAEHAKADLTRPGTMTEASPVFRGAMAAIGKVRVAPLPLVPDEPDHEHVWVTALDGEDQPARDADGRTWVHCGVCGDPRDPKPPADQAEPVSLGTPCTRPECHGHPYNWHVPGPGCAAGPDSAPCPCPGFQPPATEETS